MAVTVRELYRKEVGEFFKEFPLVVPMGVVVIIVSVMVVGLFVYHTRLISKGMVTTN